MTKLDKLVNAYCPTGVEYVQLKTAANIVRGVRVVRSQLTDTGKYPVYQNSMTPLGYYDKSNFPANTTFIISAGAAGEIGYSDVDFWAADDCFCIVENEYLYSRFLYHTLLSKQTHMTSRVRRASVPRLSRSVVEQLDIPLPPLPIQREIVRILDNFTELSAELSAELTARKKQYEYYRDSIFDYSGRRDIRFLSVADLFDFKNGLNKGKEFFGKGTPIVNFTDVFKKRWLTQDMLRGLVDVTPTEIERYSAKKGDVFFTRTSETQEEIGMTSVLIDDIEKCVFSGFVLRARPKTDYLLPKFCSYFFSTRQARAQIVQNSTFTTRALTSGPKLSRILVPIPSLSEQERIVSILDRFDALTTDIANGLPAEIEARRKQYEYYRDRLLAFPTKQATS